MSDFDFDDLAVKADDTAELHLPQLARHGHTPVLVMAPATEENRAFWNALARLEKGQRRRGADPTDPGVMRQRRLETADLFAKTVVRTWRGVVDKNGTLTSFSPDECLRWFTAIISKAPDVWQEIAAFCQDRSNYRGGSIDAEEAAKNS